MPHFVLIALTALFLPSAAQAQLMCHNKSNSFIAFCNSGSLQQGTNTPVQQKAATPKKTKAGKPMGVQNDLQSGYIGTHETGNAAAQKKVPTVKSRCQQPGGKITSSC